MYIDKNQDLYLQSKINEDIKVFKKRLSCPPDRASSRIQECNNSKTSKFHNYLLNNLQELNDGYPHTKHHSSEAACILKGEDN